MLPTPRPAIPTPTGHAAHGEPRCQREHVIVRVAVFAVRSRQELSLLGVLQRVKLRHAATQLNLVARRRHKIDGCQMSFALPMLPLDH